MASLPGCCFLLFKRRIAFKPRGSFSTGFALNALSFELLNQAKSQDIAVEYLKKFLSFVPGANGCLTIFMSFMPKSVGVSLLLLRHICKNFLFYCNSF